MTYDVGYFVKRSVGSSGNVIIKPTTGFVAGKQIAVPEQEVSAYNEAEVLSLSKRYKVLKQLTKTA